jgi:hypothetical protein
MNFNFSVAFILLGTVFATQSPAPGRDNDILERKVALGQKGASSQAITILLAQVHVPGGIVSVYDRCSKPVDHQFTLQEATLEQGLNYISTIDGTRTWINQNGTIIVGTDLANRTVLKTIISDFDVNPSDALSLSTQRLLQSAEVREAAKRLGLIEMSPNLGFSSVNNSSSTPNGVSAATPSRHFHQTSLENILNSLASMQGYAVWHYEQFDCNTTSFRVTWPLANKQS